MFFLKSSQINSLNNFKKNFDGKQNKTKVNQP
jgi:hypothetical protein